jgi:hypothetical protein
MLKLSIIFSSVLFFIGVCLDETEEEQLTFLSPQKAGLMKKMAKKF